MQHFKSLLLISTLTIVIINIGWGQNFNKKEAIKSYFTNPNELGVNITNVLGNVLSLNPNNINSPYGLIYRRHIGTSSLRLGLDVGLSTIEDFSFSNNIQSQKKTTERAINSRIGYEWHLPINRRFMFSYGLDVVFNRFSDDSEISEFTFNSGGSFTKFFKSEETTLGFGGGPVLRFDYRFNDRLSLSTESTFYYIRNRSTDRLYDGNLLLIDDKFNTSNLNLVLPQSLFVNLVF
jgi:hypothetical protein